MEAERREEPEPGEAAQERRQEVPPERISCKRRQDPHHPIGQWGPRADPDRQERRLPEQSLRGPDEAALARRPERAHLEDLPVDDVVDRFDVERSKDAHGGDQQGVIDQADQHQDRFVGRRQKDREGTVHPDRDDEEPDERGDVLGQEERGGDAQEAHGAGRA